MSNFWGAHVLVDPTDMERMYSDSDSMSALPSVWEEVHEEEDLGSLEQVREVLNRVPPREADFLELYFFRRLRQTAIAELFNISQPSVVYRLQRGARRLRYLVEMPEFERSQLEADLRATLSEEIDVDIMLMMLDTTCQSEVARELTESGKGGARRITQGFVRHRFLRTIEKLEKISGMETYVKVFRHVSNHTNILNNTCRAAWDEEVIFSLG